MYARAVGISVDVLIDDHLKLPLTLPVKAKKMGGDNLK
jgi:hypothetical protein